MATSIKGRTPPISSSSSQGDDAHVPHEPGAPIHEDQLFDAPRSHEDGATIPAASTPAPKKPSSRAGSVNLQAPASKSDPIPPATAEIMSVRETASGQVLTLRYAASNKNASAVYEVALPRGAAGGLAEADRQGLARSMAKLIQAAEEHSAKKGKTLTSFTFTKPSHAGAPPSLILVLDKGEQKVTVDLSQEKDWQPSFLEASLHTELQDAFEHLHTCLHLPMEKRVHAKITRLDKESDAVEAPEKGSPHG